MNDGLILKKLKVWCLLLLAAIAAHALIPMSAPEARAAGSPFNPSTIDVSTAHNRREVARHEIAWRDPRDEDTGKAIAPPSAAPFATAASRPAEPAMSRAEPPLAPIWRHALSQPRAPPAV